MLPLRTTRRRPVRSVRSRSRAKPRRSASATSTSGSTSPSKQVGTDGGREGDTQQGRQAARLLEQRWLVSTDGRVSVCGCVCVTMSALDKEGVKLSVHEMEASVLHPDKITDGTVGQSDHLLLMQPAARWGALTCSPDRPLDEGVAAGFHNADAVAVVLLLLLLSVVVVVRVLLSGRQRAAGAGLGRAGGGPVRRQEPALRQVRGRQAGRDTDS